MRLFSAMYTYVYSCIVSYSEIDDERQIVTIEVIITTKGNVHMQILFQRVYVTGFAKRGLIHVSNFVTLRMCNSAHV